jgi:hypothetical protein
VNEGEQIKAIRDPHPPRSWTMNMIKKATLATALAASALTAAAPAEARGYHGHHGGNAAGWAIGAGILGLAVGAAVASDHHRDRDYDRRYADNDGYYRDGYYYDRDGRRYDREVSQQRDDYRRGYDRDDYYSRRGW